MPTTDLQEQYEKHQPNIESHCFWCHSKFRKDKYDMYTEEVGEFWSDELQNSVLGHPDCTPLGVEAILLGEDPVWKMA